MDEYTGAPITEPPIISSRRWIKRNLYHAVKLYGGFKVSRWWTRLELRILCYHGISDGDLSRFAPFTFMSSQTFRQRMHYLKQEGWRVISLEDALKGLWEGGLPEASVVITFDDCFKSTLYKALPVLQEYGYPATLYLTTYYAQKEQPIFRLVVQYMFWKTLKSRIDLNTLGLSINGVHSLELDAEKRKLIWDLITYAELQMNEEQRTKLCKDLGDLLEVPYEPIVESRALSLMNRSETAEAASLGIDVQLHTHRHRFPIDPNIASAELEQNRRVLKEWLGREAEHFCYPSGLWKPSHIKLLAESGVKSAVTCKPGLNRQDTTPWLLNRFVDGEHISQIEFEAEMCGFVDLLRRCIRN